MPADVFDRDHQFLPKNSTLTGEEITRLARLFVGQGVTKLRLTGGEPLLRSDIREIVAALAEIEGGKPDLAITSNGTLLEKLAAPLKAAGLKRVTISLDALDPALFSKIAGSSLAPRRVLDGINAALASGLGVKLNTVIQRGVNESQVLPIARYAKDLGVPVRFIEFMDVGNSNRWRAENVVSSAQLLARLQEYFDLSPIAPSNPSETAKRYCHHDSSAEIGFISSITQPFCQNCTRARLSADGKLFTCLFAPTGHDLRALLRVGADDTVITKTINSIWSQRTDRYSEQRADSPSHAKAEMSYLGG